ncbi:MAG: RNA polymerase sigma factor [Pseudomonadota bacterium]
MKETLQNEIASLVPRLRRFAYALSGSREEGDDIVQMACVKALSRLDQFQPGSRLDSWMFQIVRNQFLDERRRRARHGAPVDPDTASALSDGGLGAARGEDRLTLEAVRRAMAGLPAEQREVLALVAIEGASYKDAAETLRLPVGTVMSRLARARARLADLRREAGA